MADPRRERKLDAIYRNMHADYKGRINGARTVMVLRGGSCLVPLHALTDDEIIRLLPRDFT